MRDQLEKEYFELGNLLPKFYPDLNFENHCYWRIALDNAVKQRWTNTVDRPAYKNISTSLLEETVRLLNTYKTDQKLLEKHNEISLKYRDKKL